MEVQVSNNQKGKKVYRPKTAPQIDEDTYSKWLTDKYNRDTAELKAEIINLERRVKELKEENKRLTAAVTEKRLKYMDDMNNFSGELMKDATIQRYKREIDNQNKAIKRLRNSVDDLIAENIKLKNLQV